MFENHLVLSALCTIAVTLIVFLSKRLVVQCMCGHAALRRSLCGLLSLYFTFAFTHTHTGQQDRRARAWHFGLSRPVHGSTPLSQETL